MGCAVAAPTALEPMQSPVPSGGVSGPGADPWDGPREKEYTLCEVLGEGSFGVVYTAVELYSGDAVAVKTICLSGSSARRRRRAHEEVLMWQAIGSHPNIVELHESFVRDRCMFIVMEECECNVVEWLCQEFVNVDDHWPWVVYEMLLGLQACHRAMVVHRDVKPINFLVSKGDPTIKLCDFGLATTLPAKGGIRGEYGTMALMSPEMLRGKRYGAGTDVWSFGVSVYFLFWGEFPFAPENDKREAVRRAVLKGGVPRWLREAQIPEDDEKMRDFLLPLLQRNPRQRATVEEALKHPFLRVRPRPEEQPVEQGSMDVVLERLSFNSVEGPEGEVDA